MIYNTYADIILTKGDANNSFDSPLSCEAIQGKLIFHIPKVGKLFSIIQSVFSKANTPKFSSIIAYYHTDLTADFSMEAAPTREVESKFGIDEIEIWIQ